LVAAATALLAAPAAAPAPGVTVGAVENGLVWQTAETVAVARLLGLRSMVVTLDWEPEYSALQPTAEDALNRVVTAAGGIRIVLGVHNNWTRTPTDAAGRERYCGYVASALRRFPQINDIIVWNEPNVGFFWRPQFAADGTSEAPLRYGELLAHCYDVLHGVRPGINVIGPVNSHWGNDNPNAFSNVSHSPARFIRALGAAYRASGRTRPLFDTLGHHPYPLRTDEHPSTRHTEESVISIGDTERLLAIMREAFGGTAQRTPQDGLPIWYLETGYQTAIPGEKARSYSGFENWPGVVPDVAPAGSVSQAQQLTDSLRLMYCQPHVEAIFNFLLKDESDLAGWQSGLFWADGSPKASYEPYRSVVRELHEGRVNCGAVPGAPSGGGAAAPGAPAAGKGAGAGAGGSGVQEARAARGVTKLTYRGLTRAAFSRLRLRAQLTRGVTSSVDGLAARQVTFTVGASTYLTGTNPAGVAAVVPSPPLHPGRHDVTIRFHGDELSLGSAERVTVQVVNSRGRVESRGRLRLSRTLTATVEASSDGTTVKGTLTLRKRGRIHRVRLIALGIFGRGRTAWLSGTDGRSRYDISMKRAGSAARVRIQILQDGAPLHPAVAVPAARLLVSGR